VWLAGDERILTLAAVPNSVFPSLGGMGDVVAVTIIVIPTLIAGCQVLAVWQRSMALSQIVGLLFVILGVLGLLCGCVLAPVVREAYPHDWGAILATVIYVFFVGTWLFAGVVMMSHGDDLFRKHTRGRS
jgi:hypothetical protein